MPELPEVETIRLSLLPVLAGRMIGKIEILTPEVWLGEIPEPGIWRIDGLTRRGKYLMINLQAGVKSGGCLLVHLRMTGQLLLQTDDLPPVKHDHIRLRLDQPSATGRPNQDPVWLVYHDTRRFGRIWMLPDRSAGQPAGLAGLGPEPLEPGFDG
ncbi:MAG TPA: hypothetical protein DD640_06960, partial [Clostridiales bacterium]|nr:hypothetical protein [Clostridiales bacterium]